MTKDELLNSLNIKINKIRKIGKVTVINNKYVLKRMNRKSHFYDYLISRNFNNFPKIYSKVEDEYELMDYIEEQDIPSEQKIEDMIYIMSILHLDTTFDKPTDLDYIKEIYEKTIDELNELKNYYLNLQNYIEEEIYMTPSNYLLIRNISLIYKAIDLSRRYLDKWYKEEEKIKTFRYVYTHGNLKESHILENNGIYLISWDKSKIDLPIKDIEVLYRNSYKYLDLDKLLLIYEHKYPLSIDEKNLLFSLLLIPEKIDISDYELSKLKRISDLVLYLKKTYKLLEDYPKKSNNNTNK